MGWKIVIDRKAIRESKSIPKIVRDSLKDKITQVADNPIGYKHTALKGKGFKGMFKLRIGDYRVIYSLDYDQEEMTVWTVKHRKDVYK